MSNLPKSNTPKVDALEMLLETFTVEQLRQIALAVMSARLASVNCERVWHDLTIRFKDGNPRWIGVHSWEELEKPSNQ